MLLYVVLLFFNVSLKQLRKEVSRVKALLGESEQTGRNEKEVSPALRTRVHENGHRPRGDDRYIWNFGIFLISIFFNSINSENSLQYNILYTRNYLHFVGIIYIQDHILSQIIMLMVKLRQKVLIRKRMNRLVLIRLALIIGLCVL